MPTLKSNPNTNPTYNTFILHVQRQHPHIPIPFFTQIYDDDDDDDDEDDVT